MHLIFDFDNTITTADTVNALGLAGAAFQLARNASPPALLSPPITSSPTSNSSSAPISITPTQSAPPSFEDTWTDIAAAYGHDYGGYSSAFVPSEDRRTNLDDEIAFQHGLRAVDLASVRRVENSGMFRGMRPSDLREAGRRAVNESPRRTKGTKDGEKVGVRKGFGELVLAAKERGERVSIVSANWSRSWIRGVIGGEDECIEVVAQEIDEGGKIVPWRPEGGEAEASVTSRMSGERGGEEGLRIATSGDKLVALKMITQPDDAILYFGDSPTDLECLLHAAEGLGGGIGVVIADDAGSKLLRTFRRLERWVPHVADWKEDGRLVWARDFEECLGKGPFTAR